VEIGCRVGRLCGYPHPNQPRFARIGVGEPIPFDRTALDGETRAAIRKGVTSALEKINAGRASFAIPRGRWTTADATFGSRERMQGRYLARSSAARFGLYGLDREEAVYMSVAVDVEALYTRYGPMVLRRCRSMLGDEADALDALQDTFVQVLRHRERLDARVTPPLVAVLLVELFQPLVVGPFLVRPEEDEVTDGPPRVFNPARARRMALEMAIMASSWPMIRLCISLSMWISFSVSAAVSFMTGMPVQSETIAAMSPSVTAGSPAPRSGPFSSPCSSRRLGCARHHARTQRH
jgi:hypothetical protein